jgi:hypothetical protein
MDDLCPVKVDQHEPRLAVLSNHHVDISYIAVHKVRLMKLAPSCSGVFAG